MRETDRHVAAVMAALQTLDAFESGEKLRLSQLHERTGLARSRLLRLTGTLEAAGYLVFDSATARYEMGPKVYRLAWLAKDTLDGLTKLLHPRLDKLTAMTDATAFFSIVRGDHRLVIAKSEPEEGIRYTVSEGQLRPLHVGATGAVLLAFGSPERLARVLRQEQLPAVTPATITDPKVLAERVEQVARAGIAFSIGEGTNDAYACAVPVHDPRGRFVGALTLAAPTSVLTHDRSFYEAQLLDEARHLSTRVSDTP